MLLLLGEMTIPSVAEQAVLLESPYIDHAPTGPDGVFPTSDVDVIVDILHAIKQHALPTQVA